MRFQFFVAAAFLLLFVFGVHGAVMEDDPNPIGTDPHKKDSSKSDVHPRYQSKGHPHGENELLNDDIGVPDDDDVDEDIVDRSKPNVHHRGLRYPPQPRPKHHHGEYSSKEIQNIVKELKDDLANDENDEKLHYRRSKDHEMLRPNRHHKKSQQIDDDSAAAENLSTPNSSKTKQIHHRRGANPPYHYAPMPRPKHG